MRIAVDVMGGDHGCQVVIDGIKLALQEYPALKEVHAVGDQKAIEEAIVRARLNDSRLNIVHASEVLGMDEKPLTAVRRKRDSSMVRAAELVKNGKAEALISPGNTGGLVAAATLTIRRLDGVERPAIATMVPSSKQDFILIDAGANPDCKPFYLAQFAVMGAIYAREIIGHARPRVGVLSNGKEEIKGNELTRETAKLLQQLDLNFIGYVEGNDMFNDRVDVVVTDGFSGNLVLKTVESMGKSIVRLLKRELAGSMIRKLGALLAAQGFRNINKRMDPDAYGGAPLLGLKGNVIKAHGSARERAIMNAIRVSMEAIQHHLKEMIQDEVQRANQRLLRNVIAASATVAA